jgi:parallel beta-helix repeat protein
MAIVLVTLGIGVLGASGPVSAAAATRNVAPSGADTGDCTSSACKTISYAVSKANAGDTIVVGNGLYSEGVTINKMLILQSSGAVIDASGHDNGILVSGAGAKGSVVSGFAVRNATFEGILVQQTSHISILDNTVTDNDRGAAAAHPVGECAAQGEVPGDCGEAIHLWSVSYSLVSGNMVKNNMGGILLTDESGPTFSNKIVGNTVTGTGEDCGIVLASHVLNIGSPVSPSVGGVYDNLVSGNSVINSGPNGAGVGLFAAAPGASTYNNKVDGNTLTGNGMPGVALHSHAPFQNVNGNSITNNTIASNGMDLDAGTDGPTGISIAPDVAAGASPLKTITISGNKISQETYGIFMVGVATKIDVSHNTIDAGVKTPVSITVAPAQAGGGPTTSPIQPPNTGDGGLVGASGNGQELAVFALLISALAAGFLGAARLAQTER